jgi:hypothetical protein
MLPQLTQNFALPPASTNDLNNAKIFSILLLHPCKDSINCTCRIHSNHNSIQLLKYKNLTNQRIINKCKNKEINWAISGGCPTRVILINSAQHLDSTGLTDSDKTDLLTAMAIAKDSFLVLTNKNACKE